MEEVNFNEENETREGGKEAEPVDERDKEARRIKKEHPETHATPTELTGGGTPGPGSKQGTPAGNP